jgi:hypothetical protein
MVGALPCTVPGGSSDPWMQCRPRSRRNSGTRDCVTAGCVTRLLLAHSGQPAQWQKATMGEGSIDIPMHHPLVMSPLFLRGKSCSNVCV